MRIRRRHSGVSLLTGFREQLIDELIKEAENLSDQTNKTGFLIFLKEMK